jgi:uncharacterized hydrophobic protein (TIGR00271 family)
MLKKVLRFVNIQSDLADIDHIHESIASGIIFKGTNLWILVLAIIIASIGLNMNSTAVIIGAMLISPLMGPINGIGYSIATYDFPLFRKALKNFLFAVCASLIASTLYFLISPLSTAHSELLARTSPTIYDVLIALFGGLAGIVAISSKLKGNVLPGVAIATALMPPLCTAGYGLATAQFYYFFGAFYLFAINSVFIAISTVLFSQLLKFPIRTIVEPEEKKRVNRWITVIITITIIPSIYFGYLLVQKEKFSDRAGKFISTVSVIEGSYLLKSDVNPDRNTIQLIYGGASLGEQEKIRISQVAKEFDLENVNLVFSQGFSVDDDETINKRDDQLNAEIHRLTLALQKSKEENSKLNVGHGRGKAILLEAKMLFPQITGLVYSQSTKFVSKSSTDSLAVSMVVLSTKSPHLKNQEKLKVEGWLRQRMDVKDLNVYYEKE